MTPNRDPMADSLRRILMSAVEYHQAGSLDLAERHYRAVLALDSANGDALHLLGVAAHQAGRHLQAVRVISRALSLVDRFGHYFLNLGNALKELGATARAIECWKYALSLAPDSAAAFSNLGAAQAPPVAALRCYGWAIRCDPGQVEAYCNLADALNRSANREMAAVACRFGLVLSPAKAELLFNLGNALKDLDSFGQAVDSYGRAILAGGSLPGLYSNLGLALGRHRRSELAMAAFLSAAVLDPGFADAYCNLGSLLHAGGGGDEGQAVFLRRAVRADHHLPEAYFNLGNLVGQREQVDDAIVAYRGALSLRPHYHEAWINLGFLLAKGGKNEEARSMAGHAALLPGLSSSFRYSLGALFLKCGRPEDAIPHLCRYLDEEPDDKDGAALILARLGHRATPDRAPEAHLHDLYLKRALTWDRNRSYRGHELVANMFLRLNSDQKNAVILDAGCGTGLVGELLKNYAQQLDGVDLSMPMLNRAMSKKIYDNTYHDDLFVFLGHREDYYDYIISAATLIHFGPLDDLFKSVAEALRKNGCFIFTVFPNDDDPQCRDYVVAPLDGLAEGGCYLHHRTYIQRLAGDFGFSVVEMTTDIHEYHGGKPFWGLATALRRI